MTHRWLTDSLKIKDRVMRRLGDRVNGRKRKK
jgi:hypothetical protein